MTARIGGRRCGVLGSIAAVAVAIGAALGSAGSVLAEPSLVPTPAPQPTVAAEGGAAAMAYSRLQFERLSEDQRSRIRDGLLRYCELDTLAMVMVVEGWREMCGTAS